MKLSDNFSLNEFLLSEIAVRLGILNEPDAEHIESMKALCCNVLQPTRDHFGVPIVVTSGYRSALLNSMTPGSSSSSQHTKGEAADFIMPNLALIDVFEWMIQNVPFDQLIFEYERWIHVSYRRAINRNQVLECELHEGRPRYKPYVIRHPE